MTTKIVTQHNLAAIEEWEKSSLKESTKLAKLIKTSKSTNPNSLFSEFPILQESFYNLNKYEFDETILWWNNVILEADVNNLVDLFQQINEKIHNIDYRKRIITESEFKLLEKFSKNKINETKLKNENPFSIIILHRNDIQDHKKGRPAISLGKSDITNKELVIPGTTRKNLHYQNFHLKLNDIDTYFYLKDIISINKNDNLGLWRSDDQSVILTTELINQLLQMIDSYNLSETESNNFLISTNYVNVGAGISKTN